MIQIAADIFSGRPNPTWVVELDEAKDLLQEISQNQSVITPVDQGYQGLGYRGLIVEALTDNFASKFDVPENFRLGHSGHPKGLEIADRVLTSMQRAQVLDTELHALLVPELQRLASREEPSEADFSTPPAAPPAAEAAARTCWIELGKFNPGFWNNPAHISRNNCYNYASNHRTDTFAQPGRATGHQATVMACANVTAAALSDGLHHRFEWRWSWHRATTIIGTVSKRKASGGINPGAPQPGTSTIMARLFGTRRQRRACPTPTFADTFTPARVRR